MYHYVINYWDEIDCESRIDSGVVTANSYGEAAQKVTEYYGTNNVADVKITELEQILSEEELLEMFEEKGN